MSMNCECHYAKTLETYNGHTVVCFMRTCHLILLHPQTRDWDSEIYIAERRPLLIFLVESLRNATLPLSILHRITKVLTSPALWNLNDEGMIQLLLKGIKVVIDKSSWNGIKPHAFIEFCVTKININIDGPTIDLTKLILDNNLSQRLFLHQYGKDTLPKIILKLLDHVLNRSSFSSSSIGIVNKKIYEILTNVMRFGEWDVNNIHQAEDKVNKNESYTIIDPYLRDLMTSTITTLDCTQSVDLKSSIIDFLRQLCRCTLFVKGSVELILKDRETMVLELFCVCKRMLQDRFKHTDPSYSQDTITAFRIKVLRLLVKFMSTYSEIVHENKGCSVGKIHWIPEYALRSDIIVFVSEIMNTSEIELLNLCIKFMSLLSQTQAFESNRRMLNVLKGTLRVVYMLCCKKDFNPDLFVDFTDSTLRQHTSPIVAHEENKEQIVNIQKQIIGVYSAACRYATKVYLLKYAKLLIFCTSKEVRDSLWGLLVDCKEKLVLSESKSLIVFKIALIIVDLILSWHQFRSNGSNSDRLFPQADNQFETKVLEILNIDSILPCILALVEIAQLSTTEDDAIYFDITMKFLLLCIQRRESKDNDAQCRKASSVKVFLHEENGKFVQIEMKASATCGEMNILQGMDCWTTDCIITVLEFLQNTGRKSSTWSEIMAVLITESLKSLVPWYDVEKGWNLFSTIKMMFNVESTGYDEPLEKTEKITFGIAELLIIYITEVISPRKKSRNRNYITTHLEMPNGLLTLLQNQALPPDETLLSFKAIFYVLSHVDRKDIQCFLKHFPEQNLRFTNVSATMCFEDILKIVSFNAKFFQFLFGEENASENTITKLIEHWIENDETNAEKFLINLVENKLPLLGRDIIESCIIRLIGFGNAPKSRLVFRIFYEKGQIRNVGNLWNILNTVMQQIIHDMDIPSSKSSNFDIPYLDNFINLAKLILQADRKVQKFTNEFIEGLIKIILVNTEFCELCDLCLRVLNLAKNYVDLSSVVLGNTEFAKFLQKRLQLQDLKLHESFVAFDLAAQMVNDSPSVNAYEEDDATQDPAFKKPMAKTQTYIQWEFSSVIPKLLCSGFNSSISPVTFISALLKKNLRCSFIKVGDISTEGMRDVLINVYLYIHDVLHKYLKPEIEEELWEAAYQLLRYSVYATSEENKDIKYEKKSFVPDLIGKHPWEQLSLSIKLASLDTDDLSRCPKSCLRFIKQWLVCYQHILKEKLMKQMYYKDCPNDMSFIKLTLTVFKKFLKYENLKSARLNPFHAKKEDHWERVYLANHIFMYCAVILKSFFEDVPYGYRHLNAFKYSEGVVLEFLAKVDLDNGVYKGFRM